MQTGGLSINIIIEPVQAEPGDRVMYPTYRWARARPADRRHAAGTAEDPIVIEADPPPAPRPPTPEPDALVIDVSHHSSEAEE